MPGLRQSDRFPLTPAHIHGAVHSPVVPYAACTLRRVFSERLPVDFHGHPRPSGVAANKPTCGLNCRAETVRPRRRNARPLGKKRAFPNDFVRILAPTQGSLRRLEAEPREECSYRAALTPSSARFSSRTLTRGSPSRPRSRWEVCCCTSWRTADSERPRS